MGKIQNRKPYKWSNQQIESYCMGKNYKFIDCERGKHIYLHIEDGDGYKYRVNLHNLERYKPFPVSGFNPYSVENIKIWLKSNDKNFDLLSEEYRNAKEELAFKCNECGKIFKTSWDIISRGCGCPFCVGMQITTKEVKGSFLSQGYAPLFHDYKTGKEKLKISNEYGYETTISYDNFKRGKTPTFFSNSNPHTIKNIKLYLELNADGYKLMSKTFKSSNAKIMWKCDKGHKFKMSWNDFQQGKRCPICNNSKGEEVIRLWLKRNNIPYIQEYRFSDCKYSYTLPFDFFLPNDNICIEYDGIQHFEPVEFFDGVKGFNERKRNDNIKNVYCQNNGINLIRIPYTTENIEEYLEVALTSE